MSWIVGLRQVKKARAGIFLSLCSNIESEKRRWRVVQERWRMGVRKSSRIEKLHTWEISERKSWLKLQGMVVCLQVYIEGNAGVFEPINIH
jgi:hypothetical protein